MARRCREFVDSRLRRSPPDRASAVPYGQAGENAMRFPRLAHRSAAAHKLHSTPQQDRMNLISGKGETSSRLPALAYSSPEPVQTTGPSQVSLESAEVSSCDETASPSGSDALLISAAICSCWAIAFSRCSFNQGVVASARSLRALAAAAR